MDNTIVGIDVAKDRLDVAVRPSGELFLVERNDGGMEMLVERLKTLAIALVVLEAKGGFETVVAAALGAAGLTVVVVNLDKVRAFAKAIGQRAKTDPIDAAVIAHFAQATRPEPRPLPDEATRLLADLVARRRQIVEMIGAERQREKRATARIKKSIARLIKALEKELASVNGDIDDAVRGSPAWRDKENLLASVLCIDPIIARTLIADLPELGALDRKKIAALAGLAPFARLVRPMARPQLHRRRTKQSPNRPLHGRNDRQTAQSHPEGLLRPPGRSRKAQDGRPHRRRPQTPHHPQRRSQRPKTMANRLTANTVAHPDPLSAVRHARMDEGGRRMVRNSPWAGMCGEVIPAMGGEPHTGASHPTRGVVVL